MNAVLKNPRQSQHDLGKIHAIWPTDSEHLSEHLSEHFSERVSEHLGEHLLLYKSMTYKIPREHLSERVSEHLSEHSSEHYRTNLATSARTYLRLNWLNPPKPSPSSTRYHL